MPVFKDEAGKLSSKDNYCPTALATVGLAKLLKYS